MDLALATRVLYRHRRVVGAGVVLAVLLSLVAYYRVELDSSGPKLTPRKAELWQSNATIFLTEGGFPAGNLGRFTSPGAIASVAGLYARLAESDQVLALASKDGPLPGRFQATPSADPLNRDSALPLVLLLGTASTPAAAEATVKRGMEAFLAFVSAQQDAAGTPERRRVQLRVVNAPRAAALIQPRKKTLPIVVFLAVTMAAIALAFILENAGRNRPLASVEARPQAIVEVEASQETEPEPEPEPEPRREPARVPEALPEPEPEPEPIIPVRRWA